jgi:hypothetical protein
MMDIFKYPLEKCNWPSLGRADAAAAKWRLTGMVTGGDRYVIGTYLLRWGWVQ